MNRMFIEAILIGKTEESCKKDETVCPTCNGSTVGDYGQPFECETCLGTGSIPVFEIKEKKCLKSM